MGACVFAMIMVEQVISLFGLLALLSFIGVVVIITAYHIKLKEIANPNLKTLEQTETIIKPTKISTQNENNPFIYCRKCGNKLPSDSKFCSKCGIEVVK